MPDDRCVEARGVTERDRTEVEAKEGCLRSKVLKWVYSRFKPNLLDRDIPMAMTVPPHGRNSASAEALRRGGTGRTFAT